MEIFLLPVSSLGQSFVFPRQCSEGHKQGFPPLCSLFSAFIADKNISDWQRMFSLDRWGSLFHGCEGERFGHSTVFVAPLDFNCPGDNSLLTSHYKHLQSPQLSCLRVFSEALDTYSACVCKLFPGWHTCECPQNQCSTLVGWELWNRYFQLMFLVGTVLR